MKGECPSYKRDPLIALLTKSGPYERELTAYKGSPLWKGAPSLQRAPLMKGERPHYQGDTLMTRNPLLTKGTPYEWGEPSLQKGPL